MNRLLLTATLLASGIGLAHSWLGERYILIRLFRRGNLPPLLGGDRFTRQTLRFAWHLTTVAWWGFALVLWSHAAAADPRVWTLRAVSLTFLVSALLTAGASRGRHLAWIVFLAIAALAWWAV